MSEQLMSVQSEPTSSKLIRKEDYDIIVKYLHNNNSLHKTGVTSGGSTLIREIQESEMFSDENFPKDVVRLHSKVVLRDTSARHNYVYTVVLPEESDHRKGLVSVLSSIGSTLLGAKKGQTLSWQQGKSRRTFLVMQVENKAV